MFSPWCKGVYSLYNFSAKQFFCNYTLYATFPSRKTNNIHETDLNGFFFVKILGNDIRYFNILEPFLFQLIQSP